MAIAASDLGSLNRIHFLLQQVRSSLTEHQSFCEVQRCSGAACQIFLP